MAGSLNKNSKATFVFYWHCLIGMYLQAIANLQELRTAEIEGSSQL